MGASVVRGAVELGASTAGRCALTLVTDPAAQDASGAQVFLELVRLVDVEAEERARQATIRAEQDKKAMALRVWLLGSLQHRGADPMARERARAAAQARAEDEARRRQAAADEENRRRQAAADEENRRQHDAQVAADQERWRQEQARIAAEQARLAKQNEARAKVERESAERRSAALTIRWQLLMRLQRLGADPLARERARALAQVTAEEENRRRQAAAAEENRRRLAAEARAEQERLRLEQERLRREQEAAAERARREAPERERRAQEERERLAKEEADAPGALRRRAGADIEERTRRGRRPSAMRRSAGRRRGTRARRPSRCAGGCWRWLQRQGADPLMRQHLEEARIAARRDEQRRQYEARARRELEIAVARRAAFDLRFRLVGTADGGGRGPGLPAQARRGDVPRDGRGGEAHGRRRAPRPPSACGGRRRRRWICGCCRSCDCAGWARSIARPVRNRRPRRRRPRRSRARHGFRVATTGTASPGSGARATTNTRPTWAASGSRPRRSPSAARWSCAPAAGSASPSAPRPAAVIGGLTLRRVAQEDVAADVARLQLADRRAVVVDLVGVEADDRDRAGLPVRSW